MKRVLFLCTGNSCRSQMAQAVLGHLGRGRFEALSAGAKPAGHVHPLALRTIREAGMEADGLRSKSWDEFKGQPIDFVITVCGRARETCPVWPGRALHAHWGFEDPGDAEGAEEEKMRAFRKTFAEIRESVERFLAIPMDELSPGELEKRVAAIGTR